MRLSMIRAGIVATIAAVALAACSSGSMMPGYGQSAAPAAVSQSAPATVDNQSAPETVEQGTAPETTANADNKAPATATDAQIQPDTSCATSPPQYWWIFKGACVKITLKPTGASFSLPAYNSITVKGSIGKNNVKGSATVYLADATYTNGDIKTWKGKAFPKYTGRGKTFIYAAAINQSGQIIKPIAQQGKPILQYIITDSKGLPGSTCGAAVLTEQGQKFVWAALPGSFKAKGKTVTITQYNVPKGFELPPKTPLYFAVNCF